MNWTIAFSISLFLTEWMRGINIYGTNMGAMKLAYWLHRRLSCLWADYNLLLHDI